MTVREEQNATGEERNSIHNATERVGFTNSRSAARPCLQPTLESLS